MACTPQYMDFLVQLTYLGKAQLFLSYMLHLELDMTTSSIHAQYTMMDACIGRNKSRVQIRLQLHSLRY